MNTIRPRHDFVNVKAMSASSIEEQRLYEKYIFFDESDVRAYFYKKRTLSKLEFLSYQHRLDNIAKNLNYILEDNYFKEKRPNKFIGDFSSPYCKKDRHKFIEPQSGDPFSSSNSESGDSISPQGFNPFSMFTDPIGLKQMSEHLPYVLDTLGDKLPDTNERQEFLNAFKSFIRMLCFY
jgi:hypothetical protein